MRPHIMHNYSILSRLFLVASFPPRTRATSSTCMRHLIRGRSSGRFLSGCHHPAARNVHWLSTRQSPCILLSLVVTMMPFTSLIWRRVDCHCGHGKRPEHIFVHYLLYHRQYFFPTFADDHVSPQYALSLQQCWRGNHGPSDPMLKK